MRGFRNPLVPALLCVVTALGIFWGWLQSANATAPQPPQLVKAKLNGQPISVLYVTRSSDTVLMRCYPGQTPSLTLRNYGGQDTQEGVLTCK